MYTRKVHWQLYCTCYHRIQEFSRGREKRGRAGTLGLQNQWGMFPKCSTLRIGTHLKPFHYRNTSKQCHKVETTVKYLYNEFVFQYSAIITTVVIFLRFFSKRGKGGCSATQSTPLNPPLGVGLSLLRDTIQR